MFIRNAIDIGSPGNSMAAARDTRCLSSSCIGNLFVVQVAGFVVASKVHLISGVKYLGQTWVGVVH
jgi:hypothetical protein